MSRLQDVPVPLVDEGLGNSSYLVDLGDGRALVIDPVRDPAVYLAEADHRDLEIAFVAETHLHADFVSGGPELAALGATVLAPAAGGHCFPVLGLAGGDEVDVGGLRLRALATPGHPPEHLAYLLLDDGRPVALFSGGSLLVGAVARTDLISPERTEELARSLWRSLRTQVLTLPDDLPVYPTHGPGSFCSGPGGRERVTTIGHEKLTNPLLATPDEDAFVSLLRSGFGTFPPYFLRLRELNRGGPRIYGPAPQILPPLGPQEVRQLLAGGSEVIDARPIAAFAGGHIPGALSIQLRPAFATWLGWLVAEDRPLVFVLDAEQDRAELVRQALKVGYEHLAGVLAGGMDAWKAAGLPVAAIPLVGPEGGEGRQPLDIRQDSEFAAGHIPGSLNVELGALAETADVPAGPIVTVCGHGERAMTAASLLERRGRRDLAAFDGGMSFWVGAGGRLEE